MFRRSYNYDLGPQGDRASDSGMIFTCFQRDLEHQYLPVQARLAELDLLNEWTVPIGSAVFAIPPGIAEGELVGERMFA
jgi:dye decolorizing peroxidase